MKENLVTDFFTINHSNNFTKKYLELPTFDQKYNFKKNIISYEEWNNYEKRLSDVRKTLKVYDHFLNELTIYLNNYHNTKYSKRYWSIILGQWLYKFISPIYFKWNLINSLKKKNYVFLKKEINTKDIIPLGIKDSVSIFIQRILNFLPQNKNALIFSTYMSNLQEIKLNLLVNNSLLYYKSLRPYLLFKKKIYLNIIEKILRS